MSHRCRTNTVLVPLVLAAVLALGQVAGAVAQEQPKAADPEPAISLPTDRKISQRLEVAKDYIKEEQDWARATEILQDLLNTPGDTWIRVSQKGPDGKETQQWVTVRAEANRVLATLPPKGMEFYRVKYGPEAAGLLKQAKDKNDLELLARVAQRFQHTDAAAEATQRLGVHVFGEGSWISAALWFERLLQHPAGAAQLTPEVLFKATAAFRHAGDKGRAEQTWKLLSDKVGKDGLKLGERTLNREQFQKELDKIAPPAPAPLTDWPLFQGSPNRSAQGVGGAPFLEKTVYQATIRAPETRRFIDQAVREREVRGDAILPAFFPIAAKVVVDGKPRHLVIYRSFWGIHAFDLKMDGKLAWESNSNWSLDRMLLSNNQKTTAAKQWINEYFWMNQHQVLWENSTVGSLSTDGERVYAIEDLALPPPANLFAGVNPNLPFGKEINESMAHSRLQAYGLQDGKLRWEAGGPADQKDAGELAGSYILGPPLPLGGKLYVLNEKSQELRLVCLDPAKGHVHWMQALAVTRDKMIQDPGRRMQAAHLAYGEGILVCPTNAGAIFGVELLTRNVVWTYAYREPPAGPTKEEEELIRRGIIPRRGLPGAGVVSSHWKASAPVVHDGKVVFTAPDGTSVHCVNLRDGTPVWKGSRNEKDLYLGGVVAGKVLVVGKDSVRALALADGKQLWKLDTGLPSGWGAASANVYYLPLKAGAQSKEPEVCAIDIDKGTVMARIRSRNKETAGNLLFYEGQVLSQSISEIAAFPQLKVKIAEMDQLLAKSPKDPVGLIERGTLKFDKGDLPGAVEDLRAALANNPPKELLARVKQKLYEVLTEWLQRDFNAAEKYLDEYKALLKIDIDPQAAAAEKQALEAQQRKRHADYYILLGQGRERQSRLTDALDAYLEFATVARSVELYRVMSEPAVIARPDVAAQARIAGLVARATPEQRIRLDEAVNEKWRQAKKADDLDGLRRFVEVFGPLFRAGREARLVLAERLIDPGDARGFPEAERHLLVLRRQKDDPLLAGRALEALARLMIRRGLFEDAAHYYRILGRDFAKTVIRDGKTGADIFNDLATDKRLLPYLREADGAWQGRIRFEEQRGVAAAPQPLYRFQHAGEPLPFFRQHHVGLNLNLHQLQLVDRATGEDRWSQKLTPTRFQNYIHAGQPGDSSRYVYHNLGHLVVLPVAHMVFGIDPVNKQLLWEKSLFGGQGVPPQSNVIPDPRDGTLQIVYQDGWVQRLGQTGPVTASAVCLMTREGLTALDPVSGKTLWVRSDIASRSHLFGDDQHVIVVEQIADGSASGTRVLRAADGTTVSAADFAGLYKHRQRVVGSSLLLWEADDKKGATLRLYDVPGGKDVWKQEFLAGTVALRGEGSDLAGAVGPGGTVLVFDLTSGREVLKAAIDPKHLDKPQAVYLLRDRQNYYVMIHNPTDAAAYPWGGPWPNLIPGSGIGTLQVNGEVYAFRRQTGELAWHNPVPMQMLVVDQFDEMPFLLFTARYQKLGGAGVNRFPIQGAAVKSINKRDGKLIYDQPEIVNGIQFHTLRRDPKTGRVEFAGFNMKITFTLVPGQVEEK